MATTYDFVAANKRRSIILIAVFVLVIGLVGWALSYAFEAGPAGVVSAVVIAVIMSLVGYFSGDKIALISAGARGPITKDDNPYLYRLVENLCITAGLPLPKIYLLEVGQINAFATGRDPQHASIAVSRGAIDGLANEELEGVIAHELSHIKNYDVRFMTLVITMVGILALLSDFFWRARLFGGGRSNNDRGGSQAQGIFMIVGLILLIFAPIIGRLIQFAVSRKREFLADASGALLTRYPEGLARALEKIDAVNDSPMPGAHGATAHLYISNPFGHGGGVAKLFSTHPPIAERVTALRAMGGPAT